MFLEFDGEQLELRDSARAVLARLCPPPADVDRTDRVPQADSREQVETELEWLGWPALAIDVDLGGLGRSFVELAVVLEELGRAAAPGAFLPTTTQFVPAVREAGTPAQAHRFLSAVAASSLTGTLAAHESGRWEPETVTSTAERDGDGWLLRGRKLHVLGAPTVDEVVVAARRDNGPLGLFVVPAAELTFKRNDSIDRTRSVSDVELNGVWVPDPRLLGEPGDDAARPLSRALREATVGLALDGLGTCSAIFDAAVALSVEGGAPDQVTRHALADMLVAVETARAAVYEAVATVAERLDDADRAASVAKVAMGDCQRTVTGHALEIRARHGVGAGLETWIGRARADDLLFGGTREHRRMVADRQLASRRTRGSQVADALLG